MTVTRSVAVRSEIMADRRLPIVRRIQAIYLYFQELLTLRSLLTQAAKAYPKLGGWNGPLFRQWDWSICDTTWRSLD